jgi:colicin import membrane protein
VNTATVNRDPFMPRPTKGRGPALALALLAHVLLIAGLAFGVHWRSSEPTTMAAELWSSTPQAAAPRAMEPPPTAPPEVKKAPPVVKQPEPPPTPTPAPAPPDPQIAIEKAKRDEAKRAQAEEDQANREKAQREKADKVKADKAKAELEKQQEDQAQKKAAADKAKADKAEAARQDAARAAYLKRIQGMADATGGPTDTGTALRSSGPSASYAGRIMARIKPNILFTDTVDGNPKAVVEVKLAPDGTITSRRLIQSSGAKVWDDAVLRAVDRTEVLPRDVDGRVPPQVEIGFRPHD